MARRQRWREGDKRDRGGSSDGREMGRRERPRGRDVKEGRGEDGETGDWETERHGETGRGDGGRRGSGGPQDGGYTDTVPVFFNHLSVVYQGDLFELVVLHYYGTIRAIVVDNHRVGASMGQPTQRAELIRRSLGPFQAPGQPTTHGADSAGCHRCRRRKCQAEIGKKTCPQTRARLTRALLR